MSAEDEAARRQLEQILPCGWYDSPPRCYAREGSSGGFCSNCQRVLTVRHWMREQTEALRSRLSTLERERDEWKQKFENADEALAFSDKEGDRFKRQRDEFAHQIATLEREKQSAEERAEHWTSCAVRMDADIVALWQWMNANVGDELQAVVEAHKIPRDGESRGEPVWVCARDVMVRLRAKLAAREAVVETLRAALEEHQRLTRPIASTQVALEAARAGKTEGGR